MIAKEKIEVIIGGVPFVIPAGGMVPPCIIESWRASNSLDRAISQGLIVDEVKKAPEYKAQPVQHFKKDTTKDADE